MTHPIEGSPDGAVRAVIYSDLQCGDCMRLRRMLDTELLPKFGGHVAFEHRDFPLPKHDWARHAAVAARYFDAAGLGIEFRRRTLERIKQITLDTLPEHIAAFALEHGLDAAGADGAEFAAAVEADYRAGVERGVAKTPTMFIGDRAFIEVFTADELAEAIEEVLV